MKVNALLVSALVVSSCIALWGVVDPRGLGSVSSRIVTIQFESRGWFIMLEASALLLLAIYLAVSKYGSIRIGPEGSEPEFSTTAWMGGS